MTGKESGWFYVDSYMSSIYSLSLWLEFWLRAPAQDHLCWRISAQVFLVDLWMAAAYRSWKRRQGSGGHYQYYPMYKENMSDSNTWNTD